MPKMKKPRFHQKKSEFLKKVFLLNIRFMITTQICLWRMLFTAVTPFELLYMTDRENDSDKPISFAKDAAYNNNNKKKNIIALI